MRPLARLIFACCPRKRPGLSFVDLPDIVPPAQQPVVRLKLDNSYPTALHGKLSLRVHTGPWVKR